MKINKKLAKVLQNKQQIKLAQNHPDSSYKLVEIEWKFSKKSVPYRNSLGFMEKRVEEIIIGKASQLIWILEHPAVYTAGISAKDCDLLNQELINNNLQQNQKIPEVIKVNRGGKYTYHCEGMKIIYLMLDLKALFAPNRPDISVFVKFLESWIIAILEVYGIKGEIRQERVGIWVNQNSVSQQNKESELNQGQKNKKNLASKNLAREEKIAAIGIKLKKWVSYHGIAVNLNCDLSGFSAIVPCGLADFGITSIQKLGGNLNLNFNKIAKEKFFETAKIFF